MLPLLRLLYVFNIQYISLRISNTAVELTTFYIVSTVIEFLYFEQIKNKALCTKKTLNKDNIIL